jgi:hypothetical protein
MTALINMKPASATEAGTEIDNLTIVRKSMQEAGLPSRSLHSLQHRGNGQQRQIEVRLHEISLTDLARLRKLWRVQTPNWIVMECAVTVSSNVKASDPGSLDATLLIHPYGGPTGKR